MMLKYKDQLAAMLAGNPRGFLDVVEQSTTQEIQDMLDAWYLSTLDPETQRREADEIIKRAQALGLNDVVASAET